MSEQPEDFDVTPGLEQFKKKWGPNQFRSDAQADKAYWALVVGGIGAGYPAGRITSNTESAIRVSGWSGNEKPGENSSICIIEGSYDDPPLVEQYKISVDLASGAWESLPRFVDVEGSDMPITFRTDGTAGVYSDHAKIKLRDTRTDNYWSTELVVDRSTGRCSVFRIPRGHKDAKLNRYRE
jgi:hypothetical protein